MSSAVNVFVFYDKESLMHSPKCLLINVSQRTKLSWSWLRVVTVTTWLKKRLSMPEIAQLALVVLHDCRKRDMFTWDHGSPSMVHRTISLFLRRFANKLNF